MFNCVYAVLVWPLLDLKKKEGRWNVVTLVLEGVIIVCTFYLSQQLSNNLYVSC